MIYIADHTANVLESLSQLPAGPYCASILFLSGSLVLLATKTAVACAPFFLSSLILAGSVFAAQYNYVQITRGQLQQGDAYLIKGWITTALTVTSMILALGFLHCSPLSISLMLGLGFGIAASDLYVASDLLSGRPSRDRDLFTRNI